MKLVICILFMLSIQAKVPRSKISVLGNIDEKISKSFKVNYLESFPIENISIFDPYQENKKTSFSGISLTNIFKSFAPKATELEVVAINLYKVKFKRDDPRADNTFFVFKENQKYITIKKMGPLRIVRRGIGKLTQRNLATEGIDWVWMVQELNFK